MSPLAALDCEYRELLALELDDHDHATRRKLTELEAALFEGEVTDAEDATIKLRFVSELLQDGSDAAARDVGAIRQVIGWIEREHMPAGLSSPPA